jgi:processive 1,2-diacylglycerol beta-glucosyltransferase
MPRILLLHVSVGMGHQRAAAALSRALEQSPGTVTHVEDTLQYARAPFRRGYAGLYLGIANRVPALWSAFYAYTNRPPLAYALVASVRALSTGLGVRGLPDLLARARPDAIICTHFLPLEALARLRREALPPVYCVLTDYHAHRFWARPGVQRYFAPTRETRAQLVAAGIEPARVRVTGIPVDPALAAPLEQAAARAMLGLPTHGPLVSLVASGLRVARVREIAIALLERQPGGTLVVAAGRNQAVLAALDHLPAGRVELCTLGPQPSLDPLFAASDLVVGKAGGLTVSEVLARGVPLIIPTPVAGQEQWNAEHVARSGAGLCRATAPAVAQAASDLLAEPARLRAMAQAARAAGRPVAAAMIAAQVLDDLHPANETKHEKKDSMLSCCFHDYVVKATREHTIFLDAV